MAVNELRFRRLIVALFALLALGSLVWLIARPSGFALLATVFLSVQSGLLFFMARMQDKLRK